MLNKTIKEFGKSMELSELEFNENHLIHLELETVGDLFIEDVPPYLLVYLTKSVENPSLNVYKKGLTLCHYKQRNPYPTYVGLYEENKLSFLVRIPYEEISESNLEKAVLFLNKLHEQVANINKS
jgi:type III secretion system chaperone SycN